MAILDFLIVCVNSQPALLGYLCDINTSPTATFGNATILQPIVELLRWSTQVRNRDLRRFVCMSFFRIPMILLPVIYLF
jgi:hypothetical protein